MLPKIWKIVQLVLKVEKFTEEFVVLALDESINC